MVPFTLQNSNRLLLWQNDIAPHMAEWTHVHVRLGIIKGPSLTGIGFGEIVLTDAPPRLSDLPPKMKPTLSVRLVEVVRTIHQLDGIIQEVVAGHLKSIDPEALFLTTVAQGGEVAFNASHQQGSHEARNEGLFPYETYRLWLAGPRLDNVFTYDFLTALEKSLGYLGITKLDRLIHRYCPTIDERGFDSIKVSLNAPIRIVDGNLEIKSGIFRGQILASPRVNKAEIGVTLVPHVGEARDPQPDPMPIALQDALWQTNKGLEVYHLQERVDTAHTVDFLLTYYGSTLFTRTIETDNRMAQRARELDQMRNLARNTIGRGQGTPMPDTSEPRPKGRKVFIVHGSNHNLRNAIDLFILNELKLETLVMSNKANEGRTLPEKFEQVADECGFAVVLVTLDDRLIKGESLTGKNLEKRRIRRPRQNVVLEAGYFWGKMGRKRVAFLVEQAKGQQIPSDLSGIGYIPITKDLGRTKEELRKEIDAWKATWDSE